MISASSPLPDDVRVVLLGPVSATLGGEPVDLGGPKERTVLALLAANPASPRSQDWLIDALWGAGVPKTARKTLQTYVSRIRSALGDAAGGVITTGPGGYTLSSSARTDVEEVEALMAAANRPGADGSSEARTKLLSDALELCGSEPLSGTAPCLILDALAESYVQLRCNVIEALAEARLQGGEDPALTMALRAWVDENPMREGLWASLMLALYRSGRQTEALSTFQRARNHLVEGLGVEPGPELRDLEAAILRQDPELHDTRGKRNPAAASETLTFLFTDIEGSTVRWDLEPKAMQKALALHDSVVGDALTRAGGRVFYEGGDSLGAGFVSAESAFTAAVELQEGLATVDWPTSEPIRVRVGLHTGTAEVRGGNYFGAAVNRAARLMETAHGGQTLCSAATAALLADTRGCEAVPMGRIHLKGLERPEAVHQLSRLGSHLEFPGLHSAEPTERVPPRPLDTLHGRDAEIAEISDLLADNRLVTMTGVGGVGKTRLAVEVASRIAESHADGVVWVELAPVDAQGVVAAVAAAAGVGLSGASTDHERQLEAALSGDRALVVLDNCEHLLGPAAAVAERLVRGCGGLALLTTSREPLGMAGERVYFVPSLGLPTDGEAPSPSEALLRDRAESAGARIPEDDATAHALEEICRRLDGIPLALEFAGAQLATFTAPQLMKRLEDHFRLLGTPGRSAIARQQTIDSTVEWSYDLLDADERTLLRNLSVFVDGFTLGAAAAVGGRLADPAEAVVERLRWKSLVVLHPRPHDEPRFKLLEPVRQFALSRLQSHGDLDSVLDLHAEHFVAITQRGLVGDRFADDEARSNVFLTDLANTQLAAATLDRRDDPTDLLLLFDAARTVIPALIDLGELTERPMTRLRNGVDVDPLLEGHACNTAAFADAYAGDTGAIGWLEKALDLAERTGDGTLRAETEFHLGVADITLGDMAGAARHLSTSTHLHEELGNVGTLSINMAWLAEVLARLGQTAEAMDLTRRALRIARSSGVLMGTVLDAAAAVAVWAGEVEMAEECLEEIVRTNQRTSPVAFASALSIGRMDLSLELVIAALTAHRRYQGLDGPLAKYTAVLVRRIGESDLAALWVAVSEAHSAALAGSFKVAELGPTIAMTSGDEREEAMTQWARSVIGDRWDELLRGINGIAGLSSIRRCRFWRPPGQCIGSTRYRRRARRWPDMLDPCDLHRRQPIYRWKPTYTVPFTGWNDDTMVRPVGVEGLEPPTSSL